MGQKRGTGIQSSAEVVNFEGLVGVFDVHLDWVDHFEGWLRVVLHLRDYLTRHVSLMLVLHILGVSIHDGSGLSIVADSLELLRLLVVVARGLDDCIKLFMGWLHCILLSFLIKIRIKDYIIFDQLPSHYKP